MHLYISVIWHCKKTFADDIYWGSCLWFPSTPKKLCLFGQTPKLWWSLNGDVISTKSWHHLTESKPLSIIPCLYHPTTNQSQMLAQKAASVNTLMALYCKFAKKISKDFHSLRSIYPGNEWYSAYVERNGSLSLIVGCKPF